MSTVLLSQRGSGGLPRQLGFGAWLEAEEVLLQCDGAQLVRSDRHGRSRSIRARRVVGRTARRVRGRHYILASPLAGRSGSRYDHLIFMATGPWDLPVLERLTALRRSTRQISLWLPEVWPSELEDRRMRFESYDMVDHVFVGIPDLVDDFASVAPNSDIHYLPTAIDVVEFAGSPDRHPRPAAVVGIGRKWESQHEVLLDWCERHNELYLYDTVVGPAADWRKHRRSMASWYRNSAVAVCNYGKHDEPKLIGDLRAIPARLYEGLAAGCILVGRGPDPDRQRNTLGRVVVEDCDDDELPAALDAAVHQDRRADRAANIALAHRAHDWSHRWAQLFTTAGLPVPDGLTKRIVRLGELGDEIESKH